MDLIQTFASLMPLGASKHSPSIPSEPLSPEEALALVMALVAGIVFCCTLVVARRLRQGKHKPDVSRLAERN